MKKKINKFFNEMCDCSDHYAISCHVACPGCGRGFCSAKCGWITGHNDQQGYPCPYRAATKTTWKKVKVSKKKAETDDDGDS